LNGIPRRYSDYPNAFSRWNIISSFGSYLSIISIIFLIFVLWESSIINRQIISIQSPSRFNEWFNNNPPIDHTLNQPSMVCY
jgi:cytochrome c oxidase subunit 1